MMKNRKLRAARALAILLAAALLAAAAGCSAASSSKASYPAARTGTAQGLGDTAAQSADKASQQTSSASGAEKAAASSRKVIRSASLNLQTLEYERTLSELESLVSRFGGYVQTSRNEYGGISAAAGQSRSSSLQARIPSARLEEFLGSAGKTGVVVSREVDGQDVTQSYYDTETRLKTLRAEQDRVLALLAKATDMTDVLTIEDKLSDLQNQIEQLTGELKKWDDLVDLSTVNIVVTEVHSYTASPSSFGAQTLSTLTASLRALGQTCRVLALALVAVLPFAVFLAAIALAVLLILYKRGRLRRLPWRRKARGRPGGPGAGKDGGE